MFEEFLGRTLEEAEKALLARGYTPSIIKYVSKRGVAGATDWRVLRCVPKGGGVVELVASAFITDIKEEMV